MSRFVFIAKWRCVLVLSSLYFCIPLANAQVTFTDASQSAGFNYVQQAPLDTYCPPSGSAFTSGVVEDMLNCMHRVMTGGVAVGDFNNDGLDDVYVTRMDNTDILYRNNGDGTFTDVSSQAGITQVLDTNGALWADVDNDGDLDLYLTTVGDTRFYFYLNQGDGTFIEDGMARGLALEDGETHTGWSIATGDFDHDGYLDFFTAEWGSLFTTNDHARLLRNRGAEAPGYFEDVTTSSGISPSNYTSEVYIFAPAFVDLDQDGWIDLALASDFSSSQLYWNDGDGTFTDENGSAAIGTDENGMGSTFGDINRDGYLDWFVTSIYYDAVCEGGCSWGTTGNRLYLYDGNRTFVDGTDAFGLRDGAWGWGASMFDHSNSSYLDIIMTNGFMTIQDVDDDIWNNDVSRFFKNNGNGTTSEVAASLGVNDDLGGKGLAVFDYDNDGDVDVFIANIADTPILYANQGGNTAGDWLRVKFTSANRPFEGLNAKIRVQTDESGFVQYREMGVSTHFLGQSERVAHFGLGAPSATPIHEITVEWPLTGQVQTFNDVPRNQTFVITAPAGEVFDPPHRADANGDFSINLPELLRIIQLFNCGQYHVDASGEDGYACGPGSVIGIHHTADYNTPDWQISLGELLRIIQFFNLIFYRRSFAGEDGYEPGI